MKTFLEYVAADIISKYGTNLARTAVVFPNKRASLFFNEALVRMVDRPIWSPAYITISDLFRNHSALKVCDPIKLICDLYKCFNECTATNETLDHFYGWGQILLADFDDIDKNMADAGKVFANLRDIHELDDVSYLNAEQIEMIKKFFSNFSEEHNSVLKARFLSLWSHFYDIYTSFNRKLESEGMAYEGALYRKVVTDETAEYEYDRYIFVGFNVLQKVEQTLFSRLKKEGKAKFYWDFDTYYMPNGTSAMHNEAGHYIASYMQAFPNELDNRDKDIYTNFASPKNITYISAPTENIQARYASGWLRENNRIADGRNTAIVLGNEGLLQAVIHCIPNEVEDVNITTGYPLAQSPLSSLLTLLISLQTTGYSTQSDKYRLHSVNAVLRHPYMRYISSGYKDLLKQLNIDTKVYYPSRTQLCIDEGMELLFCNLNDNPDVSLTQRIAQWMTRIIERIAHNADKEETDPLFQESLFRTYTLTNRLHDLISSGDLQIDIITLQRLITQLIQSTSIPFHGEPAIGVQIMGVLETRNIDFRHVLLLSCNEGNMPKGVNDTSFIPYSIRKAHGLTTVDNKVAIYAYYFYRLLQRATDITLVYNSSTDEGGKGEMSRFMLQMLVESGHNITFRTLQGGQVSTILTPTAVNKCKDVVEILLNRFSLSRNSAGNQSPLLTPTAINRYMRCQLQFYYRYVLDIKEPEDNDEDSIDNRMFGNIFHAAAQKIYERLLQNSNHITEGDLQDLLKSKVDIIRAVDEAFKDELFKAANNTTFRMEYNGLQLINREVIVTYLRKLLEVDMKLTPFDIVGLEKQVITTMDVNAGDTKFTTTIGGRIDRLDRISDGNGERTRVVDYKTGSRIPKSLADVEAIFDEANLKDHNDYYLQTFVYSNIVHESAEFNSRRLPVSPALLFIQHTAGEGYDPTLCFGKEPITDVADYKNEFETLLNNKVSDIFNPDKPFIPTDNADTCSQCPYAQLCGL